MTTPLRVLIVDDSDDDAILIMRELRRAQYEPDTLRVEAETEMADALDQGAWQIVLCDHNLPGFNSLRALRLLFEKGLDIPFIIVSGTIGEDVAVAAMKSGAHDYILKDNMARLGAAVERELREAEERRVRREVEAGSGDLSRALEQHVGENAALTTALKEIFGEETAERVEELADQLTKAEGLAGYSLAAGHRALAIHRYEEALAHFQRGIADKEGRPTDSEYAHLMLGLGRAQVATLRREEALNSLTLAFDYFVEAGNLPDALATACHSADAQTGEAQSSEMISRALTLVPPDSREAGYLLAHLGLVFSHIGGRFGDARQAFDRALSIAERDGDTRLESMALANSAFGRLQNLDLPEALEAGERAVRLSSGQTDTRAEIRARYSTAFAHLLTGNHDAARRQGAALVPLVEVLGERYWRASVSWLNGVLYYHEGERSLTQAFIDSGLAAVPQELGLQSSRTVAESEQGRFNQDGAWTGEPSAQVGLAHSRPIGELVAAVVAQSLVANITGQVDRLEVAGEMAEALLQSPSLTPLQTMAARTGLAIIAAQRGDVEAAQTQYHALLSARGRVLWYVTAGRVLGLLATKLGRFQEAVAHFEDALAFCRESGSRPELARTGCDYGDALISLGGPGDRAKATLVLEDAMLIATELGMRPLAERIGDLQQRAQAPLEAAYPDGLSQREVEVLRLIVEGKTDREIAEELIIGIRTVSTHVGNILNKTGAANRTEAATYANRQGIVQ